MLVLLPMKAGTLLEGRLRKPMQSDIGFVHSEAKYLASAADPVKNAGIVGWYVLLRDDLDDLLGHHPPCESGCIVQLSASSTSHFLGYLNQTFVLGGMWDSVFDVLQYFF